MSELTLSSPNNTPFEAIIAATDWSHSPDTPKQLWVARELNWLVTIEEHRFSVNSLVGFSTELPLRGSIVPPEDLEEAHARMPKDTVLGVKALFNADTTAKGLGSKMTNTPEALRKRDTVGGIAVRSVPFRSMEDLYLRDEQEDAGHGRLYRLGRHAGLLAYSMAVDALTGSERGTAQAMQHMERNYGDKRLVRMDTPPSWQTANERQHIDQPVPPQTVLVRGGQFTGDNIMRRVGTYPQV